MKKIIALMCCVLIPTVAMAAEKTDDKIDVALEDTAAGEPDPAAYPVLDKIKGEAKNLTYDYLGGRFGVEAWLLTGPNVMQVIYTLPDRKNAMVGGALLDENGKEVSSALTKEFMVKYPERAKEILITVQNKNVKAVDKSVTSPSELLWRKLQTAGKITWQGDEGVSEVYVVLDPAAKNVKEIWAKLEPLATEKKITLHVLPLGLKSADTIAEIANVLGSKEPQQAWVKLLNGESQLNETPESANGILGMKANVELAESLSLREVPFFVYRGADTKIRILKGVPKDWDKFIAGLSAK